MTEILSVRVQFYKIRRRRDSLHSIPAGGVLGTNME